MTHGPMTCTDAGDAEAIKEQIRDATSSCAPAAELCIEWSVARVCP